MTTSGTGCAPQPSQVGHLFPRLLGQSEYNHRVKAAAPLMEAALRWLADATPASAEMLRLMDATPIPCGQSVITAHRSDLLRMGRLRVLPQPLPLVLGRQAAADLHLRRDRHRVRPGQPQAGRRARAGPQMLEHQPANRPPPGTAIVTDKGLSGEDTEAFFASPDLGLTLIRPARKDEKAPRYFPNWLRQRVEAIIWTLKNQLGLERHGGRVPAGLWARIVQRLLALNAAIWFNWQIGAPVKRSLIATTTELPTFPGQRSSSALLGWGEGGSEPFGGDGLAAQGAGAEDEGKHDLQLVQDLVEGHPGAGTFGSLRIMVQKAWARTARVTWRCQPVNERPSKWSRPRPAFSSR